MKYAFHVPHADKRNQLHLQPIFLWMISSLSQLNSHRHSLNTGRTRCLSAETHRNSSHPLHRQKPMRLFWTQAFLEPEATKTELVLSDTGASSSSLARGVHSSMGNVSFGGRCFSTMNGMERKHKPRAVISETKSIFLLGLSNFGESSIPGNVMVCSADFWVVNNL